MFRIEQTGYQLGAFINDLDLAEKISDEDFENLYKALSEYEVLFFRELFFVNSIKYVFTQQIRCS